MDKLEFEDFDISPDLGRVPKIDKDEKLTLSEKESIDLSNRIVLALQTKMKEHNKAHPKSKVCLTHLKEVYIRGADMREKDEIGTAVWAMARVNMFLRMKAVGSGVILTGKKTSPTQLTDFYDISASWLPSSEDFELAQKDMGAYELYEFDSVEQLYLDEYKKVEFSWIRN